MMHCGQKQCSVGKSYIQWPFYDSVESVADWCNDDRRIIQIFMKIEDYFFHSFGSITKLGNLQRVAINKLGKFYV